MSQGWWFWGRVLYGIPLSITGLIYLVNPQGTVESLTSFIPGGLALIYLGGFLWLFLGLAIAFNFQARLVSNSIIILLVAYLVIIHVPAASTGEHLNIVCFELLRNLSLMGGVFLIKARDAKVMPASSNPQSSLGVVTSEHAAKRLTN